MPGYMTAEEHAELKGSYDAWRAAFEHAQDRVDALPSDPDSVTEAFYRLDKAARALSDAGERHGLTSNDDIIRAIGRWEA